MKASSSIGRASVSKTEGWGFESLLACQTRDEAQRPVAKVAMLDKVKESPEHVTGWIGRARAFLIDVRAELGRVTWPTRREVWATTVVVILISALFGVYLYSIDVILSWVISSISRLVA